MRLFSTINCLVALATLFFCLRYHLTFETQVDATQAHYLLRYEEYYSSIGKFF